MIRQDKDNYYLDIAETVAENSTCLRRAYGAIIVKNDEIIATGYNGAPRGEENCCDRGTCRREDLNVPPGERYELCCSVHAEQNAMLSAARKDMIGSTLYLVGLDAKTGEYPHHPKPCDICMRMIKNCEIARIVIRLNKDIFVDIFPGDRKK